MRLQAHKTPSPGLARMRARPGEEATCEKPSRISNYKMMSVTKMMYNLEVTLKTIERKRSWVKDLTVKLQLSLERDVV